MSNLKFVSDNSPQSHLPKTDAEVLLGYGYYVGKEIGCGSFGKVKLAQWTSGRQTKDIAVKIIDLRKLTSVYKEKFLPRELEIWPQLNHENIIKIFSHVTCIPRIYVFMELAENGDVMSYVQQHGELPESLAKGWTRQLVEALSYCHSNGVAHRDVKCENLLIDGKMKLKLTDFGFSRFCLDKKRRSRLTSTTFCGSTAYAAPELLDGRPYNPFRSDVWSVGVCFFVMLYNSMPFDDSNLTKLHKQQLLKKWKLRPDIQVSKQSREFVRRTLEPDPRKRPTMHALLNQFSG